MDVGASLVSEVAALVSETTRSVELDPETMVADPTLEGPAVVEPMVEDS